MMILPPLGDVIVMDSDVLLGDKSRMCPGGKNIKKLRINHGFPLNSKVTRSRTWGVLILCTAEMSMDCAQVGKALTFLIGILS